MTLGDAAYFFSIRLVSISPQWVLSQKDPVIWTIRSTYNDKFIGIEGAAFPGARAVGIRAEGPWNIVPIENGPEHFQCV